MKNLDRSPPHEPIKVRGFFRVQIENEDGTLHGDSGWVGNQVTNLGFQNYLCALLGNTTGSAQVLKVALGTGTAPNASHTTLPGEVSSSTERKSPDGVAVSGSKTVQFSGTFGSSDSFVTGAVTLQNIGLFKSATSNDTLFAGNTYTTSSCNTNQNVNYSYEISFS